MLLAYLSAKNERAILGFYEKSSGCPKYVIDENRQWKSREVQNLLSVINFNWLELLFQLILQKWLGIGSNVIEKSVLGLVSVMHRHFSSPFLIFLQSSHILVTQTKYKPNIVMKVEQIRRLMDERVCASNKDTSTISSMGAERFSDIASNDNCFVNWYKCSARE